MKKGGIGGANTKTGLVFEGNVDFLTFIKNQKNYSVKGTEIFYNGGKVGITFKKNGFYNFLEENKVDCKKIVSKDYFPTTRFLLLRIDAVHHRNKIPNYCGIDGREIADLRF